MCCVCACVHGEEVGGGGGGGGAAEEVYIKNKKMEGSDSRCGHVAGPDSWRMHCCYD